MKKILVLTPRFPFPVIGGDRLRIYRICEALATQYELILLSLCETEEEMQMEVDDRIFKEIHRVHLPSTRSYLNVLLSLPTSTPLQVAYYKSSRFRDKINQLLPGCDATLSHLIRVGDYVKNSPIINILEMTDAISLNYKRVREVGASNWRSLIYSLEQKRLERYERSMLGCFDLLSFVSSVDRDFLFDSAENAKVYSNGVDTNVLKFSNRIIDDDGLIKLVFIGNMYSLQNMDAVLWFSREILPYIQQKNKKYILKVIGKIKDSDRTILSKIPDVIVTGTVDDVSDAALDGYIGICPMRLGAGLQNKILEYMALGMPCVTSSVGFEGIGATEGKEILVANDLSEYRRNFDSLVEQRDSYEFIANNARKFVEDNYSWQSKLAPMLDDLNNLLGK